jgi:hypothetical protein
MYIAFKISDILVTTIYVALELFFFTVCSMCVTLSTSSHLLLLYVWHYYQPLFISCYFTCDIINLFSSLHLQVWRWQLWRLPKRWTTLNIVNNIVSIFSPEDDNWDVSRNLWRLSTFDAAFGRKLKFYTEIQPRRLDILVCILEVWSMRS